MMAERTFARLWEFSVVPLRQAEFERHYGPDGSWVQLFRRAPGYLGTELLHDRADSLRYVTIDRWQSAEDWQAFRLRFSEQYEALDRRCEELTAREAPLGEYAALPPR
jgi:heme-degrading monooxygenase HmoA